jgi:hypothetical protein
LLRFKQLGGVNMSDNKYAPATVELLTKTMNELAREIGFMDPDDPKRAPLVKGLSDLTQLRHRIPLKSIGQRMDELARHIATLKMGDARKAQIVSEILRLGELLKEQ